MRQADNDFFDEKKKGAQKRKITKIAMALEFPHQASLNVANQRKGPSETAGPGQPPDQCTLVQMPINDVGALPTDHSAGLPQQQQVRKILEGRRPGFMFSVAWKRGGADRFDSGNIPAVMVSAHYASDVHMV